VCVMAEGCTSARAGGTARGPSGHKDVTLVKDLKDVPAWIASNAREGDMVITLGAGSVYKAGEEYLRRLKGDS